MAEIEIARKKNLVGKNRWCKKTARSIKYFAFIKDDMSVNSNKENPGGVRRFQYSAPQKKESLPERWSLEFGMKNQPSHMPEAFSSAGNGSFSLDDAWSIRKNVAVGPNKAKVPVATSSTSVYSRHKTTPAAKNAQEMTSQRPVGFGPTAGVSTYSSKGSHIPQASIHSRPRESQWNLQYGNSRESISGNLHFAKAPSRQTTSWSYGLQEQKPAMGKDFDQNSSHSPFDF